MPAEDIPFEPSEAAGAAADAAESSGLESSGAMPGGGDVSDVGTQQPVETAPLTIRDVVSKQLGYQLPSEVADDYSALAYLTQQANQARHLAEAQRQNDVYAQLGRQLAPHAQPIGQYLQTQQAPPAPKTYEPPAWDERWVALVDRDPSTGMYISKQGVPHQIADAVNKYSEWINSFQRNPVSVLSPWVDDKVAQAVAQARQEMQAQIAHLQMQGQVSNIVARNAEWAYARDAQGNPIIDPLTGQFQPTPAGARYVSYVRSLGEMGVANPVYRDQIARQLLQNEISGTQPPPPPAQTQAARTRTRNQNPLQALGALERSQTPGATEPGHEGLSVADRLAMAFEQNGLSNRDIQWPSGV